MPAVGTFDVAMPGCSWLHLLESCPALPVPASVAPPHLSRDRCWPPWIYLYFVMLLMLHLLEVVVPRANA